jgi:hypothetical protein
MSSLWSLFWGVCGEPAALQVSAFCKIIGLVAAIKR